MQRFVVLGQSLDRVTRDPIVSDTIAYLEFDFSFSADWEGLEKHVLFNNGVSPVGDKTLVEDKLTADQQINLTTGKWKINVVGVKIIDGVVIKRITTNEVTVTVFNSGNTSGEPFPPAAGSDLYVTRNQTTEQEIIGGVPKLAADRVIDDEHHLADKKYVDDHTPPTPDHNDLGGLQGGTTNEYYHVTAAEKTVIGNTSGTNTGDQDVSGAISTHNADMNAHSDLVALITAKRYGVRFDGSASNGTRLFDAAGMSAAVGTGSAPAYNDFDSILPWSGMRRCNTTLLNGERVPTYFEGEAGYSNTAADVFVYVPLFYYFRSDDDSRHVVSMTPLSGYRAPSKFIRGDGSLRSYVFLPAYTAGLAGGVPVSRSGYYPHITSLNGWMTLLAAKHTGDTLADDVWIEGMKDDEIKCILMDIEFATRDHQTIMMSASSLRYATDQTTVGGVNQFTVSTAAATAMAVGQAIAIGTTDRGAEVTDNATILTINTLTGAITFAPAGADVTVSIGNYVSSRPWKSGACDSVVAPSGSPVSNTSGIYPCKYRGIENPYGNQHRWRWDYLQNNRAPSVLLDPTKYAAGSISADYKALSYTVPTSDGYATVMGFDPAYPYARVTKTVGGGSTTYFADYFYQATGISALFVGGSVISGRYAGVRLCSVYCAPSSLYWAFGAALSPA